LDLKTTFIWQLDGLLKDLGKEEQMTLQLAQDSKPSGILKFAVSCRSGDQVQQAVS
jgi:hypothetical protein